MKPWQILLFAVCAGLVLTTPLWAQLPPKPSNPPRPDNMIIYGSYAAVGIGLMAVGIGAFKVSKRGHQD